ncbi:MFS transporter [Rhodococcoides fascians]|uniref:MFS transporter n=1 Tax=Rhodococcoides fascians TaxID=1828 RepID=UPI0015C62324|nr:MULTISPECIES: MFS transporter [Rhodococcus]
MSAVVDTPANRALIRKTYCWVLPVLCSIVFIGYLDRISVAYAGPSGMSADLALTATTFGLIGGAFTIGYVACEIPGAFAMNRLGARRWITIIASSWGLLQAASALMPDFWTLLIARVLVGVAEASVVPAAYAYVAKWFPKRYKPFALGIVASSIGSAGIFGPMLATALMQSATDLPIPEWRFMMLLLGLLAVVAALVWHMLAADAPSEAAWLTASEKVRLSEWLASENDTEHHNSGSATKVLHDWRAWIAGLCYFCLVYASFAIVIWAPTIVAGFSDKFNTDFNPYLAAALVGTPAVCTLVVQVSVGGIVGRHGHPAGLMIAGTVVGAAGCILTTVASTPWTMMIALCIAACGATGVTPVLLALIPRIFTGRTTVMAFTVMNMVGASAGLVGPYLTGLFNDLTGNNNAAFYFMAVFGLLGGFLGVIMSRAATRHETSTSRSHAQQVVPQQPRQ